VLARHALGTPALAIAIVDAYVKEGAPPLVKSVLVGAVRFVARKVAVVLDVKKSHDVFGESIAFALTLDIGAAGGAAHGAGAGRLGAAIYRTLQIVGSAPLEAFVRAGREAYSRGEMDKLAGVVGREVDAIRDRLEPVLRQEMTARD
jgi:hypothetical protein